MSSQSQRQDALHKMHLFVFCVILVVETYSIRIQKSFLIHCDVDPENSSYDVTSASSILDCAVACSSSPDCLSFGFEPTSGTCHQRVQNTTTTSGMNGKKNWLLSNISLWTKISPGLCSDQNCKGERCTIHHVTKAKIARVTLPPEHCPVPVDIPNANISRGEQQEGSVRTYTCNHNYLDTSVDSTTAETTCMTDGKWSKVQLTCSGPYFRFDTIGFSRPKFTNIPSGILRDHVSALFFLVRACNNSNLRLYGTSNHGQIYTFTVVIGGWANTKSAIRKYVGSKENVVYNERGIVSCEEFRPFWITWDNRSISVGKGSKSGHQIFMKCWAPKLLAIHRISVSPYIKNKATWLFKPQI